MTAISGVIITFNEEKKIEQCLKSILPVVDEIVVLDSLSTDRTEEICAKYGVRFIKQKFLGYIEQKNHALSLATHNLVLSLDADECLSDELAQSILAVKQNHTHDGYTMNRLTRYIDKWIYHSGWYPDTKLRLFDKTKGMWGGTNPHDKIVMQQGCTIKPLNGDLLHYSYDSLQQHREQARRFAIIGASAKFKRNESSTFLKTLLHAAGCFFKTYIIKAGFLDGYYGWIIAVYSTRSVYMRYSLLEKRNLSKLQQYL
ncbi:MAG: glycosyltransferase family 2 protein [Bacteroidetes bacterium]|jgi:glycosyltransferase involved in cell wall biosynthesis|nr:glycosyltransferase family 2 protein [Bacteroidota bacterium]